MTEISFGQTIDAPLTVTEKLTLSGEVSSHNGRGDGSITCLIKRVTSDSSSHELHASIGKKFYLYSKIWPIFSTFGYGSSCKRKANINDNFIFSIVDI